MEFGHFALGWFFKYKEVVEAELELPDHDRLEHGEDARGFPDIVAVVLLQRPAMEQARDAGLPKAR